MAAPILVDLSAWPGAVIGLDAVGTIRESNGRLDQTVGRSVIGTRFADLLDLESSARKWNRMWSRLTADADVRWELVLRGSASLLEPRAFTMTRGADDDLVWLVEHPADRRLEQSNERVTEVNTELAAAQRALVRERGRLSHALDELERSNAALDEFAHAVSHDLKAPLRAIIEYSQLLDADASARLEPQEREYVERLCVLSSRMRTMIESVLAYARAGRVDSPPEVLDTTQLVREIVEFLAPPPDVAIDVGADMPTFELQRAPFEQVMRNLIGNAIKHRRPDGARVRVSAADAGEFWDLSVADDGPGIDPKQHERIWGLFQTGRSADGTGIGLALVRRIADTQHGRAWVESAPGAGACFHVLWPKRPHRSSRAAP